MALTVAEQQSNGSNSAGFTFTLGAGSAVGDFLVVVHTSDYYAASDLTTPTGTAASTWTNRGTNYDAGTNASHGKVWTAPVTTGGAQTVILNSAHTDEERTGFVFRIPNGGYDLATWSSTGAGSSTSHVAPTSTPPSGQTDDMLLCVWVSGDGGGDINYTVPGSMTGGTERDVVPYITGVGAYEQLASASATGTRTATASAARAGWYAVSVLVKNTAVTANYRQAVIVGPSSAVTRAGTW